MLTFAICRAHSAAFSHAHMLTIALVCIMRQDAKVVRRERNTKCVSENFPLCRPSHRAQIVVCSK